ncbi:hypothetical protein ANN_09799 [Periplaneta americana]|uniref:Uncharacterized protein n=1 Tax=Periplaneta americana TaxID=6978 RepID=A0ABQ8TMA4_PERAM|nr:hypothetical protein ANN_09799 [Periplaneta americana]
MTFANKLEGAAKLYPTKFPELEEMAVLIPISSPFVFTKAPCYQKEKTLTLIEELRLTVFENKVLRKIFGAKRDKVTGERRKLHNTELHALYSSPDIIRNIKSRRLRWAGHVVRMSESRNAYRVLVGRPEEKRPLGRPSRRREDNIKMDLRELGYDDRDWISKQKKYEEKQLRRGVPNSSSSYHMSPSKHSWRSISEQFSENTMNYVYIAVKEQKKTLNATIKKYMPKISREKVRQIADFMDKGGNKTNKYKENRNIHVFEVQGGYVMPELFLLDPHYIFRRWILDSRRYTIIAVDKASSLPPGTTMEEVVQDMRLLAELIDWSIATMTQNLSRLQAVLDNNDMSIRTYEIFPCRPNTFSRMMSETRSAEKLRDETRKTSLRKGR